MFFFNRGEWERSPVLKSPRSLSRQLPYLTQSYMINMRRDETGPLSADFGYQVTSSFLFSSSISIFTTGSTPQHILRQIQHIQYAFIRWIPQARFDRSFIVWITSTLRQYLVPTLRREDLYFNVLTRRNTIQGFVCFRFCMATDERVKMETFARRPSTLLLILFLIFLLFLLLSKLSPPPFSCTAVPLLSPFLLLLPPPSSLKLVRVLLFCSSTSMFLLLSWHSTCKLVHR